MDVRILSSHTAGSTTTLEMTVARETHTLGCLLETHLRRDPDVVEAAYVQDHPLEDAMRLRVSSADPAASVRKAAAAALAEVEECVAACRSGLREGRVSLEYALLDHLQQHAPPEVVVRSARVAPRLERE